MMNMTFPAPAAPEWYEIHTNLVILTAWLAEHGHTAQDVAEAVETPWSYEHEYRQALAELAQDA